MKVEKNKIVFGAVLVVIVLFLMSYSMLVLKDDESENETLKHTLVPDLEESQNEYDSKLDAINDLKEVRESNAPSIYNEKLIDSLGFYDPELPQLEKQRIVDSIYDAGKIRYSNVKPQNVARRRAIQKNSVPIDSAEVKIEQGIEIKALGLEHQLFFADTPKPNSIYADETTDENIFVVVDGDQVIRTNSRLRMRLSETAKIGDQIIPINTPIYGLVSFQPNRALIKIETIDHKPTNLKAFDLEDGNEGIYVENNFRAEASNEVMDDVIGDINIPTVPQIGGIKQVFKRSNRNVRITVVNNYKLILKPKS